MRNRAGLFSEREPVVFMSYLRVTTRMPALCALACAMYALLIAGSTLLSFSSRKRLLWRSAIFRAWAKATVALLGIKITARGTPPEAPFFLVSNHLSYVDVLVLASQVDCVFIAKRDIASWPVIGPLCRSVGTIFIDRRNRRDIARVNAEIEKTLAEGRSIVLFAEGTSTKGDSVSAFKPGLLEQASRASLAVSYAALSYSVPAGQTPAHLSVCWWGDMTFLKHLVGLLRLRKVQAEVVFGSERIRDGNRKMLASKLRDAVIEQFIPVIGPEEECFTITN
jgi:1-acyl-sn-glycerol-3-phosphate acyltransferase